MAEQANLLGVRGWVRNCWDGSLEATLAGAQDDVDRLMAWARRGPAAAAVESVEVFDAEGEFRTFEQLPTV